MVEAPVKAETLLIAAVSLAALETAGFIPAMGTAITLAAVTVRAEIKHRATGRKVTHALAKTAEQATGTGFERGHWTTGDDSWQDDSR